LGTEGWNAFEDSVSAAAADPNILNGNYGEDGTLYQSRMGATLPRNYSWAPESASQIAQPLEPSTKDESHKLVDNGERSSTQQLLNEPWAWEATQSAPQALSNPSTPLHVDKGDQLSWVESDSGPQNELSHEPQPSSVSLERHTEVKSSATSMKSTHRARSSTSSQTLRRPPRRPASTKLRTAKASQTFKLTKNAPTSPPTDDTHRTQHNNVEKQYRMRMNAHFENLLATIPKDVISNSGIGEGGAVTNVTKAETLILAVGYIKTLERQEKELSSQNKLLEADVARFKKEFVSKGGVLLP
jgi:site-specific DNA-cytosine methylase